MRILSVIDTLMHGGAETVLVNLAAGLREHQHRVIHFSRANGGEIHPWIAAALARAAVPCLDVHWETMQDASGRQTSFPDFEPDVVLYHWWRGDILRPWREAMAAEPPNRRPFFVAVLHHGAARPVPLGFDAYVLVTGVQLAQVAPIDPGRVTVIPNGVDLDTFAALPPKREAGTFTVGRISGLRSGKIPEDWVRTAASFNLKDTRFVIAGDGPLKAVLEADARTLGVEDQFVFPGYVRREDVPRMLSSFDVFCYVTSTAVECHPLALLEACAAGVPVVAEARGGVQEIVSHEVNGLLVNQPAEIGPCLHRLQSDPGLRRSLSEGARASAQHFSIDRQLDRYNELLKRIERVRLTDGRLATAS